MPTIIERNEALNVVFNDIDLKELGFKKRNERNGALRSVVPYGVMHDDVPPEYQAVVGWDGDAYAVFPGDDHLAHDVDCNEESDHAEFFILCPDNVSVIKALLAFFKQTEVKEYYDSLKK